MTTEGALIFAIMLFVRIVLPLVVLFSISYAYENRPQFARVIASLLAKF